MTDRILHFHQRSGGFALIAVLGLLMLLSLVAHYWLAADVTMVTMLISTIIIIAIRETVVARVKIVAHRRLNRVDSAIQSSRITMVVESVAFAVAAIPDVFPGLRTVKMFLLGLAAGASIFSGMDYYWRYRK